MKKYLLFPVIMCMMLSIDAQFVIPEKADVERLIKRKLLVATLDDENDNNRLNDYLKESVTKMWSYGAVEFMRDPLDIPEKLTGKKSEYAVLYFSKDASAILGYATVGNRQEMNAATGQMGNTRTYALTERFRTSYFAMRISLPDRNEDIIEVGLHASKLDSTDILFLMQQTRLLINAGQSGEDILAFGKTFSEFAGKKLYINKADLSEKGEEFVIKKSKHAFEILKPADFEKLVIDQLKDGYYVKVVYCQEMKRNAITAVDIKTGRIYSRVGHLGDDCKSTFSGSPGSALQMNFTGICAKMIVEGLYLESEQNRKYKF